MLRKVIKEASCRAGALCFRAKVFYHIDDLMKKRYSQKKSMVYRPALHLYKDKMLQGPFNERMFIFVLLELDRSVINGIEYTSLFEYVSEHVNEIESFETISTLFTSAYEIKNRDTKILERIAVKGFQLLRKSQSSDCRAFSYHSMRFLIGISGILSLSRFSDHDYNLINLLKTKPLFLTYILELFWKEELQDQYQIVKNCLDLLVKQEAIIPFSDMHHMTLSIKYIKDPRYIELVNRLQENMKKKMQTASQQQNSELVIDEEVLEIGYQEYMSDLRAKYL